MSSQELVQLSPRCHCRTWSPVAVPRSSLPLVSHACHCRMCRQQTGALAAYFVHLPPGTEYGFTLDEKAALSKYEFNELVMKYFCGKCGAKIASEEIENGETRLYLYLGVFPPTLPTGEPTYKLQRHIFVQPEDGGAVLRYSTTDDVPRFLQFRDSPPADSAAWSSPRTDPGPPLTTLPLKCRCGRFTAQLKRPSACADQSEWIFSTVKDDKWRWTLCFCTSCRATSGAPHSPFFFAPPQAVVLPDGATPATTALLTHYESSPGIVRSFCPTCGANVFYDDRTPESKGAIDVFLGVVDAPLRVVLEDWIFRKDSIRQYSEDAVHQDIADSIVNGWEKSAFA